jgi:hypothetical protein
MIDTIVLTIPKDKYTILDHNKFDPSTIGLFESPYYRLGARGNFKCTQNSTKTELQKGIYKPRLTITKRIRKGFFDIPLKIEFSIPKIIYGNNFDEIQDNDFDNVIKILKIKLNEMGIIINNMDLINSQVSAIHFSKNIALTDYSTCSMIINELSKINLTKRLDLDKTSYRNEGQIIHYHCNSYEIVIYNKIKDLEQSRISEKRSIESDNLIQLNLFDNLKIEKPFEVLRIEVRLNTREKIKQVLKTVNITTEITFKNLFNKDISKNVVCYYWQNIESDINICSIDVKSPSNTLGMIINSNIGIKPSKALKLLSAIIIGQEVGFRTLRNILNLNGKNNDYWYKLLKELKEVTFPKGQKYQSIKEISKSIRSFAPLSLKYYQNVY